MGFHIQPGNLSTPALGLFIPYDFAAAAQPPPTLVHCSVDSLLSHPCTGLSTLHCQCHCLCCPDTSELCGSLLPTSLWPVRKWLALQHSDFSELSHVYFLCLVGAIALDFILDLGFKEANISALQEASETYRHLFEDTNLALNE